MPLSHSRVLPEGAGSRHLSRTLLFYIWREFGTVLACCLGGFLLLFMISALFNDLSDFIEHQASPMEVIRYFLLLQPEHLIYILPMSLLLASMYTVANLCRNNELTALSASGLSLPSITLPLWSTALLLAGVQLWVSEAVTPRAQTATKRILQQLDDPHGIRAKRARFYLAFHDRRTNSNWVFENFSVDGLCENVIVTGFREDVSARWELRAKQAIYRTGCWEFLDVQETFFDAEGLQPVAPPKRYALLRRPDLTTPPKTILYSFRLKPTREMNILDLYRELSQRGNDLASATRITMWTHLFGRLFSPFSCLVAVLLGVPLATNRERRSPMRSFIVAVGLMAVYYATTQSFLLLGRTGVFPPLLAASVPVILFTGWGAGELYRKR